MTDAHVEPASDGSPAGSRDEDARDEGSPRPRQIVVVGPDGQPMAVAPMPAEGDADDEQPAVEEPAKVMRIGTMIKQLLEEVRSAPLDEASRLRMKEIHQRSIKELEGGLSPDLRDELERLSLPFTDDSVPSESELRIAQAQLVGWLEGVFHGLQTALFAQQMAARVQLEQMRRGQLPPGMRPDDGANKPPAPGQYL